MPHLQEPRHYRLLWDLPPFSGSYWNQFSQTDGTGLDTQPCAEDLSDGELLTGLCWSTYFGQNHEPAEAQWSHTFTDAHTDCYAVPDSGHGSEQEQDSPISPPSPTASAYTKSPPPLPVSTGLFQPETPPCEVLTPYREAMYFREQAIVIQQEDD